MEYKGYKITPEYSEEDQMWFALLRLKGEGLFIVLEGETKEDLYQDLVNTIDEVMG